MLNFQEAGRGGKVAGSLEWVPEKKKKTLTENPCSSQDRQCAHNFCELCITSLMCRHTVCDIKLWRGRASQEELVSESVAHLTHQNMSHDIHLSVYLHVRLGALPAGDRVAVVITEHIGFPLSCMCTWSAESTLNTHGWDSVNNSYSWGIGPVGQNGTWVEVRSRHWLWGK